MVDTNFDTSLRALWRRQPFKPFTVELVSGDRVEVDHPEALVFRAGVAVCVSPKGAITIFDHEGVAQLIANSKPASA